MRVTTTKGFVPSSLLIQNAKILANAARQKHNESESFLVSLHFAQELESINTNFGPELDTRLNPT